MSPFGCLLNPQGRHQARTKDWVIQTGVIQTILFFHPVSRHTNTKHKSYTHPKHQTPSFCIEYELFSQTNNGDGWSIASAKTFNMSQMLIPSLIWVWYSQNWGTPLHRNRYDTVSPIKVSALEKKAEMKIKINRRCLASKEESFFLILWQSKAICCQPKKTTPLSPEQRPIQPQICAGCPEGSCCQSYLTCPLAGPQVNSQQEDFHATNLIWKTLFKLTHTVVSKVWLIQSFQSVLIRNIHHNRYGHVETLKMVITKGFEERTYSSWQSLTSHKTSTQQSHKQY